MNLLVKRSDYEKSIKIRHSYRRIASNRLAKASCSIVTKVVYRPPIRTEVFVDTKQRTDFPTKRGNPFFFLLSNYLLESMWGIYALR